MTLIHHDQNGFSHVEAILLVVIVAIIGFVGWDVYHAKQNTNSALDAAAATSNSVSPHFTTVKTKSATVSTTTGTDNQSLQTDLNSATSATNQDSQDISNTNTSLNDQSTFTSVPQ